MGWTWISTSNAKFAGESVITAKHTGIGLTLVANALGYECVIVAPQNASQEKIQQLEMLGAELLLVPSVPYADSHHYIHTAERVARGRASDEPQGAIWARQFDNPANQQIHYDTTGREIWEQTWPAWPPPCVSATRR